MNANILTPDQATEELQSLCTTNGSDIAMAARVEALIAVGAEFDEKGPGGFAPMHLAARHGHKAVCDVLIRHHADVNISTGQAAGDTPLHYAAAEGHEDICRALLDHGADVNAQNRQNQTPLHRAALNRKPVICRILTEEYGADVTAVTMHGMTPLQNAASNEYYNACRVLLRAGGDIYPGHPLDAVAHLALASHAYIKELRSQLAENLPANFPEGKQPTREQCLTTSKDGKIIATDIVLDACVIEQFHDRIAMPLIQSHDAADRQLARDIYNALPRIWRDANRATEVQLNKIERQHAIDDMLRPGSGISYGGSR